MSYSSFETSVHAGQPIELYRFQRYASIYTYTSGIEPVTYLSETYAPDMPIKSAGITDKIDEGRDSLTLTLQRDHPLAQEFRIFVPSSTMSLTIYAGHYGDTEFIVAWQGNVVSVEQNADSTATIYCESVRAMLKRVGLSYKFGSQCQHTIYRGGCGLAIELHSVTDTVTYVSADGLTIGANDLALLPDGAYAAGVAVFNDDDYRTITSHSGTSITVNRPFESLEAGDTVVFAQGCNRSITRCKELNNFERYLGFNTLPERNPFESGL